MAEPTEIPEEEYSTPDLTHRVYFMSNLKHHWWDRIGLTKRGFEHVLVARYDDFYDHWVLLDWTMGGLDIAICNEDDLGYLDRFADSHDVTVVEYRTQAVAIVQKPFRITPMNCVAMAAHSLKLPELFIFTPYQLYRQLLKRGGKVRYEDSEDTRTECGGTRTPEAPESHDRRGEPGEQACRG